MRIIDYQQRIAECSRQAETAPNPQARIQWKRMEQFWRVKSAAHKPKERLGRLHVIEPSTPVRAVKR
jgi:hypothetical protein